MSRMPIPYYRVGVAFEMTNGVIRRLSYSFLMQAEADRYIAWCDPFGGVSWRSSEKLIMDTPTACADTRMRVRLDHTVRDSQFLKEEETEFFRFAETTNEKELRS